MSTAATIVAVPLGERSYEIEIGSGTLSAAGRFAAGHFAARRLKLSHVVVVTDENVEQPHGETVVASLAEAGLAVDLLVVEPGESSKSVDVVAGLWEQMLAVGTDRRTAVVAVGGGVIGDLAGFVAATFARGLPFLQVPTTLLAQVDSSVGGKVGVNLPGAKNMVGAFWQPRGVLIDTDTLGTLPEREYRAGLAEVVKYGVILDAEFFAWLESNSAALCARDAAALHRIIVRSCELKAGIVCQDEREETGLRSVLNYGHTFCHAFEALTGYETLLHGEAVAMGMDCAARLAARLGRIDASLVMRQAALLKTLGLATIPPQLDTAAVIDAMSRDKKTEHGRLRFVLPSRLGHVELVDGVPRADVEAALAESGRGS